MKETRFVIVQNLINHLKNNSGYFRVPPRMSSKDRTLVKSEFSNKREKERERGGLRYCKVFITSLLRQMLGTRLVNWTWDFQNTKYCRSVYLTLVKCELHVCSEKPSISR